MIVWHDTVFHNPLFRREDIKVDLSNSAEEMQYIL
jgi:hypothetical protein